MKSVVLLIVVPFLLVGVVSSQKGLRYFFDVKLDNIEKDGNITPEEFRQFLYYMDSEGGYAPVKSVKEFHKTLDANNDGVISWSEFYLKYGVLDAQPEGPEQIHLSLTNLNTEMVVMWSSDPAGIPTVKYGLTPQLGLTAVGTHKIYSVGGIYVSKPISTVKLSGLTPGRFYYYSCGDGSSGGMMSPVLNFTTAPNYSPAPSSINWAVFGDMGTVVPLGFEVTQAMVNASKLHAFDMALHLGDLAYAGVSSQKWEEWEPTWDVWMNQIQPLASLVPYQTTVGNHESYYNFTAYNERFTMPGPQTQGNGNFWFSFQFGNIHMTVMDTEEDYSTGSPQYDWIESDLAAARANPSVTWLFVSGHRPYYSSDESEYSSHSPGGALLTYLEPLFIKNQVDMVLTGHMHCYERTYPVFNGTVTAPPGSNNYTNPGLPIYIVQGTAGAFVAEKWVEPQPIWSAKREQHYGYARLTVTGSSLYYAFYDLDFPNLPADELWIHKS